MYMKQDETWRRRLSSDVVGVEEVRHRSARHVVEAMEVWLVVVQAEVWRGPLLGMVMALQTSFDCPAISMS